MEAGAECLKLKVTKVPKVTLLCHHEAQPKDLASEWEILRFAQNDSFAVTLGTFNFRHFSTGRGSRNFQIADFKSKTVNRKSKILCRLYPPRYHKASLFLRCGCNFAVNCGVAPSNAAPRLSLSKTWGWRVAAILAAPCRRHPAFGSRAGSPRHAHDGFHRVRRAR